MAQSLTVQIVSRLVALPLVATLILFLPAGTFDFWEVYVYFGGVLVLAVFAMAYFLKHDPELLRRRLESNEKESTQKFAVALLAMAILAVYVTSGLDRRFAWSEMNITIQILGFVFVFAGYQFIVQVMKQNSFAARTVRVEESQQLVDTGLYSYVRHPMYSGVVVMYLGTPLALGSWWGLLPTLVFSIALQIRIANEEEVLEADLVGYAEYKQRVKSRMIPGIW